MNQETDYIDFDEFIDEAEGKPKKIKVMGEFYTLPPSPPFAMMLKLATWKRQGVEPNADLVETQANEILGCILGENQFNRMVASGITLRQMERVIQKALSLYMEADSKNAESPAEAAGQMESPA